MNKVKLDENLWMKYDFPLPFFLKRKTLQNYYPKLLFLPSQEVFFFFFFFKKIN
jgi:hypothetical protein